MSMTASPFDYDALRRQMDEECSYVKLEVDMKDPDGCMKRIRTLHRAISKRKQVNADRDQQRQKEDAQRALQHQADVQLEQQAAATLQLQEQELERQLLCDGMTGAPEPPQFEALIAPKQEQASPAIDLSGVACIQPVISAMHALSGRALDPLLAFEQLLSGTSCPPSCPDDATAQAAFRVVVCSSCPRLVQAAASSLLRWWGASQAQQLGLVAAAPGQALAWGGQRASEPSGSGSGSGGGWVPGAADFLSSLKELGYTGGAAHAAGVGAASTGRGADGSGSGAAGQALPQLHNVKALLWLMAGAWRASTGAQPPEGHGKQLAVALLRLRLDPALRAGGALPLLDDALGGLLEAFGERWARSVLPELAARIADPLGPSHRAALRVLRELPRAGVRAVELRRHAALALIARLCPGGGGVSTAGARSSQASVSPSTVLDALPRRGAVLRAVSGGGKGKERGAYWALLSLLDATDVALWTFVDVPDSDARLDSTAIARFTTWLLALEREMRGDLRASHVRSRAAELDNHYNFSAALV